MVDIIESQVLRVLRSTDKSRDANRQKVFLEVAYKLYASRVYTLCLRLLASVRAAEEATVQVFVRFSREALKRWDESWVAARLRDMAIEEALSRLRFVSNRKQADVNSSPLMSQGFGSRAPLNLETLDQLVQRLPDELRVAFVLHDREGLGYQDVADHLQIRKSAARRLIHQSRIELVRLRNETQGGAYEDDYRNGSAVHAEQGDQRP